MELARSFSPEQYASALESWDWIGVGARTPVFASPFGDIVLRDDDGSFWFLDTLGGKLTRRWADSEELRAELDTEEGQDEVLLAGLAMVTFAQGMQPGPDQVFAFKVPPVLGGAVDPTNIQLLDFVIAVDISGQIHGQIKDLPPGTEITGVTVAPEPS